MPDEPDTVENPASLLRLRCAALPSAEATDDFDRVFGLRPGAGLGFRPGGALPTDGLGARGIIHPRLRPGQESRKGLLRRT